MKINQSNLYDYQMQIIGNHKVEFFTEKIDTLCKNFEKYEFFFKIEESTSKKISFFINDLHKIYSYSQKILLSLIDNVIMNNLNVDKVYQLVIEAEAEDKKELDHKQRLYDYHFDRLAKNYSNNNVLCTHSKEGYVHTLTFMKLKNA